jgi:flagellar basal-body rod protein FlgF
MIYGLYLSAMGVLTHSNRQDVIANNLANAETVGFKRDLALFREQFTEARLRSLNVSSRSNATLEGIGGGLAYAPTYTDLSQGEIETTGNPLDVAVDGNGFIAVRDGTETRLTRDGRFTTDREGYLATSVGGHRVLDNKSQPIKLESGPVSVAKDGTITQSDKPIGTIGLFDVAKPETLIKRGGGLFGGGDLDKNLHPATGQFQGGALERTNVEPSSELAALMDTQRQLEANANMIRIQDQTLGRLVNDVGKIG